MAANLVTNIASSLADNGGPTQTFALLSGRNAIDAVPDSACVYVSSGTNPLFTNGAPITIDQLGFVHPSGVFDQSNRQFFLRNSNTPGSANEQFVLGNPNDMPLGGKWAVSAAHFGAGVFRPSNGLIYLKNSLATGYADDTMVLGIPGDQGLAGDWNGIGYDSSGVYRSSNQHFYLSNQVCNCSVFGDYAL